MCYINKCYVTGLPWVFSLQWPCWTPFAVWQLWPSCVYGWRLMSPHLFPICSVRAANHCSLFHDSSRDCLFGHFIFPFRLIVFGLSGGPHTHQLISLWTILLTQTQQCCVCCMYIVNIYYIIWFAWFIYSQVHKYWDIDTILTFLALYTTTMDFKWNEQYVL